MSQTGIRPFDVKDSAGFTLIELIAVLALLAAVMAISAPTLGRFFKARSLNDEAKRVIALTKFARNEAISEGIPMMVWFDTKNNAYGLQREDGTYQENERRFHYRLDDQRRFEAEETQIAEQRSAAGQRSSGAEVFRVTFLPDGSIDETSIYSLTIKDLKVPDRFVRVARTYNRLDYEIRNQDDTWQRRTFEEQTAPASGVYLR